MQPGCLWENGHRKGCALVSGVLAPPRAVPYRLIDQVLPYFLGQLLLLASMVADVVDELHPIRTDMLAPDIVPGDGLLVPQVTTLDECPHKSLSKIFCLPCL